MIGVGPYEVRLVDTDFGDESEQAPAGFNPLERYSGELGPMPKVQIDFFSPAGYQTNSTVTRLIVLGGSAASCKLRLQDTSVSAVHFSLVLTHVGLYVVDLAGRGGIAVNRRPVTFDRLGDRDELQVGTFLLRARYSGEIPNGLPWRIRTGDGGGAAGLRPRPTFLSSDSGTKLRPAMTRPFGSWKHSARS